MVRIIIGAAVGMILGGLLGHFGKCRSGACPLTSNPWTGAIFGAVLGGLAAWAIRGQANKTTMPETVPAQQQGDANMSKFATITMRGRPLTLTGEMPAVGAAAPDFTAVDTEMKPVRLSDYRGKVVILSTVPSLDTGVCDTETRRFNTEAAALGEGAAMLTVSMDLPFAQKRWCGSAGIDRVKTLSDHREAAVGRAYGVLVGDLRLLARAVFVVDAAGVIRYRELVPEVASEPNYDAALAAARACVGK